MMEYKDNDFGNLIKSIRNKNKINAETLVRGICSVKVLNNIESGKTSDLRESGLRICSR